MQLIAKPGLRHYDASLYAGTFNNIDPEFIRQLSPEDQALYPVLPSGHTQKPISKDAWANLSNTVAARVPISVIVSTTNKAIYAEYLAHKLTYVRWVHRQKCSGAPGTQRSLRNPAHPGPFGDFGDFDDDHGWGGQFASGMLMQIRFMEALTSVQCPDSWGFPTEDTIRDIFQNSTIAQEEIHLQSCAMQNLSATVISLDWCPGKI